MGPIGVAGCGRMGQPMLAALLHAGFDARGVSAADLAVVIERLLPEELVARGIEEAEGVSRSLIASLAGAKTAGDSAETPDSVFRRLTS